MDCLSGVRKTKRFLGILLPAAFSRILNREGLRAVLLRNIPIIPTLRLFNQILQYLVAPLTVIHRWVSARPFLPNSYRPLVATLHISGADIIGLRIAINRRLDACVPTYKSVS